ncbi:MAG: UPF0164 family protein [candidate division KSB1 bacterium]|nr:UPF0164 family protein [candidate division KSB1 bacterium]
MRKNGWTTSIVVLAVSILAGRPDAQAGKYGASFLEIGVGARGLGMGGAYIALSRDVSAFHWNPAGLGYLQRPQLAFMYASQFGSLADPLASFNHLGAGMSLPGGAGFAVNWVRLASDQIPIYPELSGDNLGQRLRNPELRPDGQPLGYFADVENAFYFSFAKLTSFEMDWGYNTLAFPVEIPIGVNLKFIQQKLYDKSASGFGIDVGAMIRLGIADMFNEDALGKLAFGFVVKDITTTVLTWSTRQRDEISPKYRWGFAYEQPLAFIHGSVTFSWQTKSRYDQSNHVGFEINSRAFFLRIGSSDGKLTAGTGMHIWRVNLDYAFVGYEVGNVHRLSALIEL